jgi:fumarate hydratase subunit alpha
MPKTITCSEITAAVAVLCKEANYYLGEDVRKALARSLDEEISPPGQGGAAPAPGGRCHCCR